MLPKPLLQLLPWRAQQLLSAVEQRATDLLLARLTPRIPLPPSVAHKKVLLLGASVGHQWRLHLPFANVRALQAYQYDKTPLLQTALAQRPDLVVLKQCAAYFPLTDPDAATGQLRGWIDQLREAGVRVALATVVPVTREHARQKPGRVQGLWAFNDWLRPHAAEHRLPLLDLEAALRCSAADRHLEETLHSGDGLHLTRRTYRERLDSLIPPLLLRAFADA